MHTPNLQGAKGGGAPAEASDTLRSNQIAEIVDLLGEGQVGGLVNGLKSIYLDGVPVQNQDGTFNFADFGYVLSDGGPDSQVHDFGEAQTEVGVAVTVTTAMPVVRTITEPAADMVRVTLTLPSLVETKDNGDRVGTTLEFAIDVQSAGGGYVERWHDTISGKASSPYQRAVRIDLRLSGPPPWDVRVRRITADSATPTTLQNELVWSSYTMIGGTKLLYPNSAKIKLTFNAKNFSAVPGRAYDMLGINDWDIPSNYDPYTRTYSGSWNGTFVQGWTNSPPWVIYNLVKHRRYGMGNYVVQLPDKWVLYQLAQWCDEQVPDRQGGMEPRYTINCWIVEQREALRLLQEICAVFRGVLAHSGATLRPVWDAPSEPVASYGPANVVDGVFTYSDGSAAGVKTACTCWYDDLGQPGKKAPATWEDPVLVAKYGLRHMEIKPLGVQSPGQALRMAKWALWTQYEEGTTVTFRTGMDGEARQPGEVFQISDPAEAGERLAGRIHAATTTVVELDAPVTLAAGQTYLLWVTQPHATDPAKLVQESRTVTTAAGSTQVLTVSPAFSAAPLAQSMWLLEGTDVAPTLWRYASLTPVQGDGGRPEWEVTGVAHHPGKWDVIELDQPMSHRPVRRLPKGAPQVADIDVSETVYLTPEGRVRIAVQVSWPAPAPGLRYVLAWRRGNGNFQTMEPTNATSVDFDDVPPDTYEVQVQSLNSLGQLSVATSTVAIIQGDQNLPDNVSGLSFVIVPGGCRIAWNADTKPLHKATRLSYGPTYIGSTFFWEGNASDTIVRPPADGLYTVWAVHVGERQVDGVNVVSIEPQSIEIPYVAASAGTDGLNNATVVLYQRAASAPALPSAAVTYNFVSGLVTGLTGGWSADIPAGTGSLWVIKAVASATTATDTIGTSEWQAPVILAQDGEAGASAPLVKLEASDMVFITPANGTVPAPASTVVSAITTNMPSASYAWTLDGAPQGSTGAALVVAAFPAGTTKAVEVTVTSGTLTATDRMTLYSIREGSDSFAAGLDNEAQTVACDSAGNPSPSSQFPLTAQGYAVLGSVFGPSGVTWGVQAGSNVGFTSPTISGTGAVSIAGMTADVASVVFTATRGSVTIPMKFTATKAKAGATGGAGNAGASLRTAYALYTGNPVMSGGSITTVGPTSLPATNSWTPTAATAWTSGTQTPGTNQSLLMTQGRYDPATNLTTWERPFLSNFKVGNLAALSAVIDGTQSVTLPGPVTYLSSESHTYALACNTSNGAEIGLLAQGNRAGLPAAYLVNSSTSGYGAVAYGGTGLLAWSNSAAGYAIRAEAVSALVALAARSSGPNRLAAQFERGGSGGSAGQVLVDSAGSIQTQGAFISNYAAGVPLILPVRTTKPAATVGGVALHASYGPIFSDGVNWYAPASLIVVP